MATLWQKVDQITGAGRRSAAKIYEPRGSGTVNVVNDYWWTLTPPEGRKEIPTIQLLEFQVDESMITRQIDFYVNGAINAFQNVRRSEGENIDILSPYNQLFPKDKPTRFEYIFPFYNEVNFEVNTPVWASLDTLEAGVKGLADLGSVVHPALGAAVESVAGFIGKASLGAAAAFYPKVGIMDRPKLWERHEFRSYTIKIPLYNTFSSNTNTPEWVKNRELCELLVNQNLYNKLTFITGIPPVFYEVLIPGQHYSPAACVTNLTIYNRGNIRQLSQNLTYTINGAQQTNAYTFNVPDVYEINMTLTDLVIPSKNLFQAIQERDLQVSSRLRTAQQTQAANNIANNFINSAGAAVNAGVPAATQTFYLITNPVGTTLNAVQSFLPGGSREP